MPVATLPPALAANAPEVPGLELLTWDLHDPPPRPAEIEVVTGPPARAPWMRRLDELPALRGLVLSSAGYDHVVPHVPPGVELANAVGVHDSATSEIALALILAAQRDIPSFVLDQEQAVWSPQTTRRSLADARVLVLGYGGIGHALTTRLLACEATVTAVASRPRPGDDLVDQVHGVAELMTLLPAVDVLAVSTPLSAGTRGLLDADALAALPDDALVVNVGRGPVIDTEALVAECASGRLRAALDVTDPEPLPAEHPLWSTRGVLISPHTGGPTSAFAPRMGRYLQRQLTAYLETGHLEHVVHVGEAG